MNKIKHTPGPWKVEQVKGRIVITAPELKTYPNRIARIGMPGSDGRCVEANACLIAAAPDLLEACILQHNIIINILTDSQLDTRIDCDKTLREYFKISEQTIQKAKGE